MNEVVINIFLMVANIVALLLVYYSIDRKIETKNKFLYLMVSIGAIGIWVSLIYNLSFVQLPKEIEKQTKDMLTFAFVPVNTIIVIPAILRTFIKNRKKEISQEKAKKRIIIMVIIILILSIGEIFYFRNIKEGIVNLFNERKQEQKNIINNEKNENIINNQNIENDLNIEK